MSVEIEKAVIASALLSQQAVETIVELLRPDDFTNYLCRTIFEIAKKLHTAGIPVNLLTVIDNIDANLVASFLDLTTSVASFNDPTPYCHTLTEKTAARRLSVALVGVCNELQTGDVTAEIAQDRIAAINLGMVKKPERRHAEEVAEFAADLERGEMRGVRWCVGGLQSCVGPMCPGEVIVLGGRPSSGKTAFALSQVMACVRDNTPCDFFSIEMSMRELVAREFCMMTGIPALRLKIRAISQAEKETVYSWLPVIQALPLHIDDEPRTTPTILRRKIREGVRTRGTKLAIIDYLQLLQSDDRMENRVQQLTAISREIKLIAKEMGIPIILLSQLKRPREERKNEPPELSDLRECGAIEQDADVVIFTHRKIIEGQMDYGLIVGKNRNGELGTIQANFDGAKMLWQTGAKTVSVGGF